MRASPRNLATLRVELSHPILPRSFTMSTAMAPSGDKRSKRRSSESCLDIRAGSGDGLGVTLANQGTSSPSAARGILGARAHNKSGLVGLSFLELFSDEQLSFLLGKVQRSLAQRTARRVIRMSRCLVLPNGDGRLSHEGKKVAFGYQLQAWAVFGRSALEAVSASKNEAGALTISHLCGTRNCCRGSHMVLESKTIQDTRTHCHWLADQKLLSCGVQQARQMLKDHCPHSPRCWSRMKTASVRQSS